MSLVSAISGLFKWRQFEPEVILLAVGWYLRFSLSYRDVEELLAERGIVVDRVGRYLNNIVEQGHRAIKWRVKASQHFRSFWGAWRTLAGYGDRAKPEAT